MKWFLNLKTPAKLGVGFGVSIILTLLVGLTGLNGMGRIQKIQESLASDALPGTASMGKFGNAIRDARLRVMRVADKDSVAELDKNLASYQSDTADSDKAMESYGKTVSKDEDQKKLEALKAAYAENKANNAKVIEFVKKGDYASAKTLYDGDSRKHFRDALCNAADDIMEFDVNNGVALSKKSVSAFRAAQQQMIATMAVAFAIGIFFAWFIGRIIGQMLKALNERFVSLTTKCAVDLKGAIEALENYDLTATLTPVTTPIEIKAKDDLSKMAETFNTLLAMFVSAMESFRNAQSSLNDIVGQIADNAGQVTDTSHALSAATEQSGRASGEIASGSERLARTAGETAATMEKLHSAVRSVQASSESQRSDILKADVIVKEAGETASQVASSAQTVAAVANEGRRKVEAIVASNGQITHQVELSTAKVKQLDSASQQIGAIVQSIEQIAEQTNLLALNAAIEAARAGEHGRGFAVVAEEVRKLAEQAGSATREIVTLIDNVRKNVEETVTAITSTGPLVEEGTILVQEAGESLAEIAAAAEKVANDAHGVAKKGAQIADSMAIVLKAADANAEVTEGMAAGAEQVSGAVQGVAATSQETAASSEQMSASAEEVSASANELSTMAGQLNDIVNRFKRQSKQTVTKTTRRRAA